METIKEAAGKCGGCRLSCLTECETFETNDEKTACCNRLERRGFVQGVAWAERWVEIETDHNGFATDNALDDIFHELPFLVKDKWAIFLVDNDNAAEWRGDLQRNPNRYLWRLIEHK